MKITFYEILNSIWSSQMDLRGFEIKQPMIRWKLDQKKTINKYTTITLIIQIREEWMSYLYFHLESYTLASYIIHRSLILSIVTVQRTPYCMNFIWLVDGLVGSSSVGVD